MPIVTELTTHGFVVYILTRLLTCEWEVRRGFEGPGLSPTLQSPSTYNQPAQVPRKVKREGRWEPPRGGLRFTEGPWGLFSMMLYLVVWLSSEFPSEAVGEVTCSAKWSRERRR